MYMSKDYCIQTIIKLTSIKIIIECYFPVHHPPVDYVISDSPHGNHMLVRHPVRACEVPRPAQGQGQGHPEE